jgi:transcription initiation factor TFIIB
MITIFRGFGLPKFQGKKINKKLVLKLFGEPDKTILHNSFSYEMKYIKKGISFFYFKEEDKSTFEILPSQEKNTEKSLKSNNYFTKSSNVDKKSTNFTNEVESIIASLVSVDITYQKFVKTFKGKKINRDVKKKAWIELKERVKNLTLPTTTITPPSSPILSEPLSTEPKSLTEDEKDFKIFMIGFVAPFPGRTIDEIKLNTSSMEDVFKKIGKVDWITTLDKKYWWVEHSGISFYVRHEEENLSEVFNEEEFLKKPINRITVSLMEYIDDGIKNEYGLEKRNVEDFCYDGNLHRPIIDNEKAEIICAKCGLVLSERMISMEKSGQRAFSTEERNKREQHGSPINPLMPDMQLSTMIDKRAPMPEPLRKAVKWDSRYTWKQRNMIQATSEIKRIGELLNLPQHVKIYAVNLYRKAFQLGLLKGRSIKAMVAASLYYACGAEKIPRTLGEIAKVTDSTFHNITKCYQSLIKELNLPSPTIIPGLLVSKYVTDLNLDYRIQILAGKILDKYEKRFTLSGKDPKGLVAAAIYIAAHYHRIKISQTKVSRAIGITEVTLRNRLNEMKKFMPNYKRT